jgi:hypothetical protein
MELQQSTIEPSTLEPATAKVESIPPSRRFAIWLAWVMWALVLVVGVFALYLAGANSPQAILERVAEAFFAYVLMSLLLVTFGALIVSHRPGNILGWIFCVSSILLVVYLLAQQYTIYSLRYASGSLSGTTIAMWLATQWPPYLAVILIASFVLLLFPTGSLLSPRWKPLAWLAGVVAVFYVSIIAFRPGPLELPGAGVTVNNPLGIPGAEGLFAILENSVLLVLYTLVVLASTVSVVLRYRQAYEEERQQIKWFAYAASWLLVTLGLTMVSWAVPALDFIIPASWVFALCGIPLAVGIAILKYRLYDIDVIINRTLVYVPLTGIVAGLYSASVALFQRLFEAATGERSDAAVIISTLILAASFTPIKNALQSLVDRRFKEVPDNTKELVALGNAVESRLSPVGLPQVSRRLLREAANAYGAKGGAFYLQEDGRPECLHTYGDWRDDDIQLSVPLDSGGERIGFVQLGPRRNDTPYSDSDREILQFVADVVAQAVLEDREARSLAD